MARSRRICGSLVAEMATGALGDQRLDERRDRLVALLEQHPDASFPEACADDAEVEALYRFLRNQRVSPTAVVEPHLEATRRRCAAAGAAVVIHDTTDMVFRGQEARQGLARLGPSRQGFWVHAALAVSTDAVRAPLGVVALIPFVRKMQPPGTRKDEHLRFADPTKESRLWTESVTATRTRLGPGTTVVHVMDRAADSYEIFAALVAQGERFVIRLNHDRRIETADGTQSLRAVTARLPIQCHREVSLAPRRLGNRPLQARRKHPPRAGRVATLQMAATSVVLRRPPGREYAHLPSTLGVHVVSVREVAAPAGSEPVEWRLVTTEPIDTVERVLQVVDWYRTRWLIEEFFKALKTGCAFEKRQLESLHTLLVALALLVPIAWQLLLLRHLAHATPGAPVTAALSRQQLHVLHASPAGRLLGRHPTLPAALRAVARLGGHLKQNGDPGWLVLGRGMQNLLWMERGWVAAQARDHL